MHVLLESEEGVEDISVSRGSLVECGFQSIGVARESLGDGRQAGVNSAGGDHHFLRCEESAGELFLEVSAEGSSVASPCEIRSSVSTNAVWQEARIRAFRVLSVVTSGM